MAENRATKNEKRHPMLEEVEYDFEHRVVLAAYLTMFKALSTSCYEGEIWNSSDASGGN